MSSFIECIRFNAGVVILCKGEEMRRTYTMNSIGLFRRLLPKEAWDKEWPVEYDFEAGYVKALPMIEAHAKKPVNWFNRHVGNHYHNMNTADSAKEFFAAGIRLQREGKRPALYIRRLW